MKLKNIALNGKFSGLGKYFSIWKKSDRRLHLFRAVFNVFTAAYTNNEFVAFPSESRAR